MAGLQKAFHSLNSAVERSHIADVYSLEARTRIDLMKRNHRLDRIRTITVVSLIVLFVVAGAVVIAMHYRRRATEKKLKSDLYAERLAHSREADRYFRLARCAHFDNGRVVFGCCTMNV